MREKLEYYPYEEEPSHRGRVIAIAVLLVVVFAGAIAYKLLTGQKSITIASWSNYPNENYGFSVNYPQNWTISESENVLQVGGSTIRKFNVSFEDPQITTIPYVVFGVGVEVLPVSASLETYIRGMESTLRVLGDVLEKEYIQVKGTTGYHLIVKTKVVPELKMRWVLFASGNKQYFLAFINTEDRFNEYARAFDEFVNSFSIG